jgi:ribose 5-phosphate isomerase
MNNSKNKLLIIPAKKKFSLFKSLELISTFKQWKTLKKEMGDKNNTIIDYYKDLMKTREELESKIKTTRTIIEAETGKKIYIPNHMGVVQYSKEYISAYDNKNLDELEEMFNKRYKKNI